MIIIEIHSNLTKKIFTKNSDKKKNNISINLIYKYIRLTKRKTQIGNNQRIRMYLIKMNSNLLIEMTSV